MMFESEVCGKLPDDVDGIYINRTFDDDFNADTSAFRAAIEKDTDVKSALSQRFKDLYSIITDGIKTNGEISSDLNKRVYFSISRNKMFIPISAGERALPFLTANNIPVNYKDEIYIEYDVKEDIEKDLITKISNALEKP